MKTAETQTELGLLDSAFHDWIDYMKANMQPPPLQPPTQQPLPHITTYQPPTNQQNLPPSNDEFENFYNGLEKNEYEVYELKQLYQEFFHIEELSIYSFAGLKIIREHFTKTTYTKNMKRFTIYHKK